MYTCVCKSQMRPMGWEFLPAAISTNVPPWPFCPPNTGDTKIHTWSIWVCNIYNIYLEMSSLLRVVCPPKQGLIFQPKQGSSFGFQDIHVSSVTWLSFPGADKLLIRLCKDSKACSGSRPLGISEDAGRACHSVSMGFNWGYNFYKWSQKGPEKWGFTVFVFHPGISGVISPYFI